MVLRWVAGRHALIKLKLLMLARKGRGQQAPVVHAGSNAFQVALCLCCILVEAFKHLLLALSVTERFAGPGFAMPNNSLKELVLHPGVILRSQRELAKERDHIW